MNKVFLFSFLLAFSFELIIKRASEPQCDIKTGKTTFKITAEEEKIGEIDPGNSAISLFFYLNRTNTTNRYAVQCSIPIHIHEKNATDTDDDTKEIENEKEEIEEKKKDENENYEEEKEKEKGEENDIIDENEEKEELSEKELENFYENEEKDFNDNEIESEEKEEEKEGKEKDFDDNEIELEEEEKGNEIEDEMRDTDISPNEDNQIEEESSFNDNPEENIIDEETEEKDKENTIDNEPEEKENSIDYELEEKDEIKENEKEKQEIIDDEFEDENDNEDENKKREEKEEEKEEGKDKYIDGEPEEEKENKKEGKEDEEEDSNYEFEEPEEEEEEFKMDDHRNNNIRLLESTYEINEGTCIINNAIDKNETVNIDNKYLSNQDNLTIKFETNSIQVAKCNENKEEKLLNIINIFISFRQLNKFNFERAKRRVIFIFMGIITQSLPKGHQISMDVNLVKGGLPEKKRSLAVCTLKENVVIINGKSLQGQFDCIILDVDDADSFVFVDSPYIAGIPDNSVLLNPVLTEIYISKGKLKDYSNGTDTGNEIPPQFNSTSIDSSNCESNGKFKIIGKLNSELKDDLIFELPISYPENLTASCSIKKEKENKTMEIECETNGNVNEKIIIGQNTILNKNKDELLVLGKVEVNRTKCGNAKIISVTRKLEYPIAFRQVSKFRYDPILKRIYYNFYGLTPQSLTRGRVIKMLVFVLNNGIKTQQEVTCTLNSDVELKNNGYGQANFMCETNSSDASEGVELISSEEVSGINDDLEEYQKNPNMTDQKIEETKNESEDGVGKVIDYSLDNNTNRFPPVFEILDIDTNNCKKKGKIKIKARYNVNMTKKTSFEIPLSYPASSMKCNSPKAEAGEEVTIKCKIQKDFYNIGQILIEPKIIKKKHREMLFIKKYNNAINSLTCSNFNQIKLESSSKKLNAKYTFLKTNNFRLTPNKGITFKIFLYLVNGIYENHIPINVIIIKKKARRLRNLDGFNDEEELELSIDCNVTNSTGKLGTLECTNNSINIDNTSDISSLEIESDDISGISEFNSNPIETDQNGDTSDVNESEISMLTNPKINGANCQNSGIFNINGTLSENVNAKNDLNIEFLNPPDTGGLCKYNNGNKDRNLNIECQSKDEFEEDYIITEQQFVGDNLLINSIEADKDNTFSCSIGSLSDKVTEDEVEVEPPRYGSNSTNRYYTNEKSSQGLSGGSITAIVLVSVFVLLVTAVLIAFIKNGIIFGSKSGELIQSTSSIQQANSSTNIV